MIEFYEDIIRQTIECYGTRKQSVACMEECCELVQAISKELKGKSDKEHLTEEMADVLICLEMLKIMYHVTDDELNEWVKKKQFRQLKRITESGVVTGYIASNLTAKDITCENLHFAPIFGELRETKKGD